MKPFDFTYITFTRKEGWLFQNSLKQANKNILKQQKSSETFFQILKWEEKTNIWAHSTKKKKIGKATRAINVYNGHGPSNENITTTEKIPCYKSHTATGRDRATSEKDLFIKAIKTKHWWKSGLRRGVFQNPL